MWQFILGLTILAVLSAASVLLFIAARSISTGAMLTGMLIVWLGLGLSAFGPRGAVELPESVVRSMNEANSTSGIQTLVRMERPVAPVNEILAVGGILFATGFFGLALTMYRGSG